MTRRPSVGQDIHVPSELYLSHGRDDFAGGRCRIVRVSEQILKGKPTPFVEVEERPGVLYSWAWLLEQQDDLRTRYGARRGHPDPDWRPEFNDD